MKVGEVTKVLPLNVMDKHSIATEENQCRKIFPGQIQIFLQKYVDHIASKVIWLKLMFHISFCKVKCEIK